MKTFWEWLEMVGTSAVFDPKAKGTFNWQGAPGSMGKIIEGDPIGVKKKRKKKKD